MHQKEQNWYAVQTMRKQREKFNVETEWARLCAKVLTQLKEI